MKRLKTLLLTLACLMLLVPAAMAADTSDVTINESETGHVYQAYQIFTGDADGAILSNVEWGSNVDQTKVQDVFNTTDAQTAAQSISQNSSLTQEQMEALITEIKSVITGDPVDATYTGSSYTFSSLPSGYYLIIDTPENDDETSDEFSHAILTVVPTSAITPKTSTPSLTKQVYYQDSWQKAGAFGMNDTITYRSQISLPGNYSWYSSYQLSYTDTLPDGLTLDKNSIKVVDNSGKTLTPTVTTKGQTFTVSLDNLKEDGNLKDLSPLTITYNATMNDNVVTGPAGNTNSATITYSNAPSDTSSLGTSEPSTATVYTVSGVINKIDSSKNPLAGAEFQVEKIQDIDADGNAVDITPVVLNPETTWSADQTSFTWKGLGPGTYKVTEIVTPDGYNTIEPFTFTVTYDLDGQTLSSFRATNDPSANSLTLDQANGIVTNTVMNSKGATLPSTGSTGALIMVAVGLVGFGVFFALRRKAQRQ